MAGFGFVAIGSTPFGLGTPDSATAPPPLAPIGSRFIDPTTRDYVVADDGSYEEMPRLRHCVMMALSTVLESATALPTNGLSLPDRVDSSYVQRVKQKVASALAFLVDAGEMRLDDVQVELPRPGRDEITVAYTDLKTDESDVAAK